MDKCFWTMFISIAMLSACSPPVTDKGSSNTIKLDSTTQVFEVNKNQTKIREGLLTALEKYAEADVKTGYKGYYAQSLTMAGREDIPFHDKVLRSPRNKCKVSNNNQNPEKAIDSILGSLEQHTLVIINEDHKMPRDRNFILKLLKALKAKGFTHYAAETFQHSVNDNDLDYASAQDGYYSNEPIYGRLISYAKKERFQLIAYEQTAEQRLSDTATRIERINARENAQSDNLISSVLEANPKTKILVHVGHSHVAETPIPRRNQESGIKWMAALLKEKTGINPFTLTQTACHITGEVPQLISEVYDKNNTSVNFYTDYAIGHRPLNFTNNRPNWRREIGDLDVAIPASLMTFEQPILIEARIADHPDSAVPIDRVLLRPNDNEISLLLPEGFFRVEAFNKEGRLGNSEFITVPITQ